jgi:hypothetical protein
VENHAIFQRNPLQRKKLQLRVYSRTIISCPESCQVELANPGTALILECQCLHDRTGSHKEKNGFFASKFCQEPSQRLQTALLSENGRRITFRIMLSSANRKAAIYLAEQ